MEFVNKIKDFFGKIRNFNLLEKLLDSKINDLIGRMEYKKELIRFNQDRLTEADNLKTDALREISRLSDEIKELDIKMNDILKVRCPT